MSARGEKRVWLLLAVPPILLGALIAGFMAWQGVGPSDPGVETAVRGALPGILAVNHAALLCLLVVVLRREGRGLGDIGWSLPDGSAGLLREAAVGLACGLVLYLLKELAVDSVRALASGNTPTFTTLFRFRVSTLDVDMAVVATTLVFVEESIYRGYAIPRLAERRGAAVAVALTSVAFGFLHWGNGWDAILVTALWGALLAAIFLWRRNLVAPTAAHALYNLLVLLSS